MYTLISENKMAIMKNIYQMKWKNRIALGLVVLALAACERDISDDAREALFSNNPDVFIDGFSAGLDYFPFAGSKLDAFTVDTETVFEGSAAMRFDVPNVGDPDGAFAGAIFREENGGRNLTKYDALTFYAKATQAGTINEIGFGQDFGENKYQVVRPNLRLTTNWKKYVIPIPDPSVLVQERGLFWYAEGPEDGDGYTFWVDNLQYEKLGTIAQQRSTIFNGEDRVERAFVGTDITISGLNQTSNTVNGDITVVPAPSYYEFSSSDLNVATVSGEGKITVVGAGTSTITATLGGVLSSGSLMVTSSGELTAAPVPTRAQSNVKSIFSDVYTGVTPINIDPRFGGSTTQVSLVASNDDSVLIYTSNNFTGIIFENTVDASSLSFMHVDVYAQEAGVQVQFQIRDIGANGEINTNTNNGLPTLDDRDYRFTASNLTVNGWNSFEIPLAGGLSAQRGNLGAIILADGPNFILDNIYFYREIITPSHNVDDSAATQVALPVGFESPTLDYRLSGFEGAMPSVVDNPSRTGINPTAKVAQSIKSNGAAFFAGNVLPLDSPIDFSGSKKLRMKIRSPKSGIPIRVQLEDAGNTDAARKFIDATTTTSNEWEELEWDFSAVNPGSNLVRIVVFFEFIDGRQGDGSTYYFDDVKILN